MSNKIIPVSTAQLQAIQAGQTQPMFQTAMVPMNRYEPDHSPAKSCNKCNGGASSTTEQRIAALERRMGGHRATGTAYPGDKRHYTTSATKNADLYKGGRELWKPEGGATGFAAGAIAVGDSVICEPSEDAEGRLRETELCAVSLIVGDELAAEATKFVVDALYNGVVIPEFRGVPLDEIIPTLDDQKQVAEFGFYWPSSGSLTFETRAIVATNFAAAQAVIVRVRGDKDCEGYTTY